MHVIFLTLDWETVKFIQQRELKYIGLYLENSGSVKGCDSYTYHPKWTLKLPQIKANTRVMLKAI